MYSECPPKRGDPAVPFSRYKHFVECACVEIDEISADPNNNTVNTHSYSACELLADR